MTSPIAWLEVARKNGKSELLAFIALYLLVADGVEGAEIYGCAIDRAQASKVFDVAARMVRLSPELSRRLVVKDHIKRIIDERTGSFYEVVAADAAGNLGHNPSGVIFDEVLTQRDSSLWDAMRTGMGTRAQPLIVAATTAGDDPASFARSEHDECVRIIDDPDRARHRFAYIRNVPEDADPWDEKNWPLANPALGDFLSIRALRQEAAEAQNDPSKENAFRQYRLNQWVQQAHRWMPMHLYRRCAGTVAPAPDWLRAELAGRRAYAGLDLAAKFDLTAWALIVPDGLDGPASMLWRFWLPDAAVTLLDRRSNGRVSQWANDGWITVTPGDVIDYDVIYADIAEDCATFRVMAAGYDDWSGEPVRQAIQKRTRLDLAPIPQTYRGLTYGMTELMALTKSRNWTHHANPWPSGASTQWRSATHPGTRTSCGRTSPIATPAASALMPCRPPRWLSPVGANWRPNMRAQAGWSCGDPRPARTRPKCRHQSIRSIKTPRISSAKAITPIVAKSSKPYSSTRAQLSGSGTDDQAEITTQCGSSRSYRRRVALSRYRYSRGKDMAFGDELPLVDRRWITRLINAHNRELPELAHLRDYYEGQQPLSYMHPELLDTLDDRVRQVVVNWPRLVVDALEERIDLTGFRLGGRPEADAELGRVWQYNDLDAGLPAGACHGDGDEARVRDRRRQPERAGQPVPAGGPVGDRLAGVHDGCFAIGDGLPNGADAVLVQRVDHAGREDADPAPTIALTHWYGDNNGSDDRFDPHSGDESGPIGDDRLLLLHANRPSPLSFWRAASRSTWSPWTSPSQPLAWTSNPPTTGIQTVLISDLAKGGL